MCLLGGKPLLHWAIEAACASACLDRIVVSSDDEAILNEALRFDRSLPLPRPSHLSSDTSLAIEYVQHALQQLESNGDRFDCIAIVQPSSPLTVPGDIDATVDLLDRSGADSAVSVVKLDHATHPLKLKCLNEGRLIPYLEPENGRMAAHELPELYVRNGSVYASRRHVIECDQVIGVDCRAYVMPRERSIDINDTFDLAFAEFLIERSSRNAAAPGTPN
jgi:CMP-N,N'-diacetyllegionaminic acid synthase